MKTNRRPLAILVILATSTLLQSYGLNRPWSGKDVGYNGAFYSILARNYVRYGFLQTKFGPVRNNGRADPAEFKYYLNHPPLLPILVALSFKCLGVSEGAARLVPLLFTLLSLWIVYLLSREFWGEDVALAATTVASFIPISLFYGSHVEVFGPLLLFFVLLAVYAYWRWFKTDKTRYLFLSALAFCLGTFVEWDSYLLALFLPAHAFFSKSQRTSKRNIVILPVLACFCLALLLFHSYLLFGSAHLKEYANALLYRQKLETVTTASAVMAPEQTVRLPRALKAAKTYLNWVLFGYAAPGTHPRQPGLPDYFLRNLLYLTVYFNPLVILFACLGLTQMAGRPPDPENRRARNFLFSLLGLGLFRIFFFYNETWEHRYIYFLLIPGLSCAAALGLQAVFSLKGFRKGTLTGVLALFFLISFGITWKLHQFNDDFSGKSVGELIRPHTGLTQSAMTSSDYSYQALYYADRRIFFGVRTWDRFVELRNRTGDPACFLLAQETSVEPRLSDYLKTHYTLRPAGRHLVFIYPSPVGTSSQTR